MKKIIALILVSFAGANVVQAAQCLGPINDGPMATSFLQEQEKEKPKVDANKVRHGSLADVDLAKDKIAVVDSKKVYLEIPAYKAIVKDKIKKGSARYIKLMEEATALYRATLEKIANKETVKLIVEVGGVSGVKTTDVTDAIIDAL